MSLFPTEERFLDSIIEYVKECLESDHVDHVVALQTVLSLLDSRMKQISQDEPEVL